MCSVYVGICLVVSVDEAIRRVVSCRVVSCHVRHHKTRHDTTRHDTTRHGRVVSCLVVSCLVVSYFRVSLRRIQLDVSIGTCARLKLQTGEALGGLQVITLSHPIPFASYPFCILSLSLGGGFSASVKDVCGGTVV